LELAYEKIYMIHSVKLDVDYVKELLAEIFENLKFVKVNLHVFVMLYCINYMHKKL